ALNGAINIREAGYDESFNSTIVGGDLLSKDLNVSSGQGTANVYVNELTGKVNTTGSAAHVVANTDTLILGEQCLIDDPTYFNTGNIVIDGNIFVGEKLAIIAGGNITSTFSNLTIRARDPNGFQDGQDIVIVAGANVTSTGTPSNPLSGSPPAGGL